MASLSASNHVARVLSVANHVADVDASSRIANSWRRCLISHKLDPARQGPPQTLTEVEIRHVAEPMEQTIRLSHPSSTISPACCATPATASISRT